MSIDTPLGDYLNYQSVFGEEMDKVLHLVPETTNLVDTIWAVDTPPQPSYPMDPLMILDSTIYTGELLYFFFSDAKIFL